MESLSPVHFCWTRAARTTSAMPFSSHRLGNPPGTPTLRVTIGRMLKAHHLPGTCPGHHPPACWTIFDPGSAEAIGAARGAREDRFPLGVAEPGGEGPGRGADLGVAGVQGARRPVGAEHEAGWADFVLSEFGPNRLMFGTDWHPGCTAASRSRT